MATVELTKDNAEEVLTQNELVFVDFWAPWCGPCKAFAPVFEKAAEAHADAVFAKVNTDDEPELASTFNITSVPTLMAFREQIGVFSQPGALPEASFEDLINQVKQLDMDEVRSKIAEQEGAQS